MGHFNWRLPFRLFASWINLVFCLFESEVKKGRHFFFQCELKQMVKIRFFFLFENQIFFSPKIGSSYVSNQRLSTLLSLSSSWNRKKNFFFLVFSIFCQQFLTAWTNSSFWPHSKNNLTNARIGRSSHICHFKCLMFCFSISLIFFQHLIKV